MSGGGQKPIDTKELAASNRYAADMTYKASMENVRAWKEQNAQARADFAPWRQAGLDSLTAIKEKLNNGYFTEKKWEGYDPEKLTEDPGYQFRLSEGERMINRQQAAGSGTHSGATLARMAKYGQDLASQEFGAARDRAVQDWGIEEGRKSDAFTRLFNMSNVGLGATGSITSNAVAATGAIASQRSAGANALGQGAIGAANAGIMHQQSKNQIAQQKHDNIMGIAKLGTSFIPS